MTDVAITIGDQEFNTWTKGDPVRWTLGIIAGWWDGPDHDMDLLPTIVEGSAAGRIMQRHRTIIVKGWADATTEADHWASLSVLENLVPIYEDVAFTVNEPPGAKTCQVRLAPGGYMVRRHGKVAIFQLTLIALDPTKHLVV